MTQLPFETKSDWMAARRMLTAFQIWGWLTSMQGKSIGKSGTPVRVGVRAVLNFRDHQP
jgi:hypothetical protein